MKQIKRVGIIGHFGFGKNLLNGQTIKTKIVTSTLETEIGKNEVIKVDTYGGLLSLFKLPYQLCSIERNSKNIIILPAHRGLKIIVPILLFLNRFYKRKLHYCVIGGWLPNVCKRHRWLANELKKFDCIYVETKAMKIALEEQGFINIVVMPNFKDLVPVKENELVYQYEEPYILCTFSRVMKEKGIEDAIIAVKKINEIYRRTVYKLDIFGQIDSNQVEWFESIQKQFPDYICYKGVVEYDNSVDTLKKYYALLFPTYYDGEGFAGTLLDAMAAGVPVVASDWKYNSEIVNENNGVLFSTHDINDFIHKIEYLSSLDLKSLKFRCLQEYDFYKPSNVIKKIKDNLI